MKQNINMKPKQTMPIIFIPGTLALWWAGLILILVSLRCDTTEPPNNASLLLSVEDVSCTEAWLMLKLSNISLPTEVTLYKNNAAAQNNILCYGDTLLYIDSLLPNQNYSFHAAVQPSSHASDLKSNVLNVTTLDTTSHNFTFQSWTFGTIGSSTLYDVAIINENDIWAVGEIMIADTSINGYTTYNAVHWDGNNWELKRIKTNACGGVDYPPIKAIFAFSSTDILFAHIDGSISYYEGIEFRNDCSLITQLNGSANKIWGVSNNNYYVVSGNGFIAHWNGRKWTKIESGTDLNIYDIWGDYNVESSNEIIFVAAQQFVGPERKIFRIIDNSVEELSTLNINQGSIHGTWFRLGRKYYIVGNGIYTTRIVDNKNVWDASLSNLTPYYTYAIRGSSLNNIFICGSFGELIHFNGFSWKTFRNTPGFFDTDFFNLSVKDGLVVVVGQRFSSGFIIIGRSSF